MNKPKADQKYIHFKGKGPYTVLSIARDCEDPQKEFVVYRAEYNSEEFGPNTVWIRELNDFMGQKTLSTGKLVSRFTLVK